MAAHDHSNHRYVHVKPGKAINMYALPNGYESTAVRAVINPGEEVELVGAPRDNKFVEVLYWPEGRAPERGFVDSRSLDIPASDLAALTAAKAAAQSASKAAKAGKPVAAAVAAAAPEEKPHTVS